MNQLFGHTECVGKGSGRYFDKAFLLVIWRLVAVATFKCLQHRGDCEWQEKQPDNYGDLRRLLEGLEKVLPAGVDHVEVSVDGGDSEEGNTGPTVQEQHEEHGLTDHVLVTSPIPMKEVVCLEGQAEEQEDVGQNQVEEKDVVAVRLPEFQFEDE